MTRITIHPKAPTMMVQDLGRPGHIATGLSRGGAMDRLAIFEAAALLGQIWPAIEMGGVGGRFESDGPCRFALTGAPMRATLNAERIAWHGTHRMGPGDRLEIGGAETGAYGYVTFAGGVKADAWLDSMSTLPGLGVGRVLMNGDGLDLGRDGDPDAAEMTIRAVNRFGGGVVRVMPGPQTGLFDAALRARVFATKFTRAAKANRQGVKLSHDGQPFDAGVASLASDFIGPGDVQMTGDGVPYVLMADCQTIGGYPRLGTIIPADLPRVAQAVSGDALRLDAISVNEADALWESDTAILRRLKSSVTRRVRDPREMTDLGAYRLIDGVTRGDED